MHLDGGDTYAIHESSPTGLLEPSRSTPRTAIPSPTSTCTCAPSNTTDRCRESSERSTIPEAPHANSTHTHSRRARLDARPLRLRGFQLTQHDEPLRTDNPQLQNHIGRGSSHCRSQNPRTHGYRYAACRWCASAPNHFGCRRQTGSAHHESSSRTATWWRDHGTAGSARTRADHTHRPRRHHGGASGSARTRADDLQRPGLKQRRTARTGANGPQLTRLGLCGLTHLESPKTRVLRHADS